MIPESLGASYQGENRCRFLVWAPLAQRVDVHILSPKERIIPLEKVNNGYHRAVIEGVSPGSLYVYRLDGQKDLPDPASHFQSEGAHGASQVVDSYFPWEDTGWRGLPLEEYIIYEIHAGTFTAEGTFDAIISRLYELKELGITAVELMPVAQFPGKRNWGYDGVFPFAVQNSYGGPQALKRLVNACHEKSLAVILDVVYNHLGPEGNCLAEFAPYYNDHYKTPWGPALNFDGAYSDEVRRFFIENALYWLKEFHFDALRLDALHAILDISARPFIKELADVVHQEMKKSNRRAYLIGESIANDARLVQPPELGGYGLDAQWNDDFHHSLHVLLTGERVGYYEDFGQVKHLVKAFREGFVYSGEYSAYRKRRHGTSSKDIPAYQFVVFAQDHDQAGNRMLGDRLSQLVSFEKLKLAAGIYLLSPFVPLLFMGEEYGETAPFPYFISHSDPELIEMVRKGLKKDFAAFQWQGEPPDPQDEATFLSAKLNHNLRNEGQHKVLLEFYGTLIQLRKEIPALVHLSKDTLEVLEYEADKVLFLRRWWQESEVITVFSFAEESITISLPVPKGHWLKRLDSTERRWLGKGSSIQERLDSAGEVNLTLNAESFALFSKES